jgi:phosphoenolpyruvate---glycerone phosphotransferase subunit DhaK
MGMALTACTAPHAGKPAFELKEDEMEIGISIHGEPGRQRVKLASADRVAEILMQPILEDLPFKSGDKVLLFVNGMGHPGDRALYCLSPALTLEQWATKHRDALIALASRTK